LDDYIKQIDSKFEGLVKKWEQEFSDGND